MLPRIDEWCVSRSFCPEPSSCCRGVAQGPYAVLVGSMRSILSLTESERSSAPAIHTTEGDVSAAGGVAARAGRGAERQLGERLVLRRLQCDLARATQCPQNLLFRPPRHEKKTPLSELALAVAPLFFRAHAPLRCLALTARGAGGPGRLPDEVLRGLLAAVASGVLRHLQAADEQAAE